MRQERDRSPRDTPLISGRAKEAAGLPRKRCNSGDNHPNRALAATPRGPNLPCERKKVQSICDLAMPIRSPPIARPPTILRALLLALVLPCSGPAQASGHGIAMHGEPVMP